jgi:DNA polymerase
MMPEGFFPLSVLQQSRGSLSRVAQCGACGLYKTCRSPKMAVTGKGRRGILLVGEAPGTTDDEEGCQLCGDTGRVVEKTLRRFDIDMRKDCWATNALICHPLHARQPSDAEVTYCRPNLQKTIDTLKPKVVICFGYAAAKSVIGMAWKGDIGTASRWTGWQIPSTKLNVWICPTHNPAYLVRTKKDRVLEKEFEDQIESAFALEGNPWSEIPDYAKDVDVVIDPTLACKAIREIVERGGLCSFDYETNMLKPDSPKSQIVSASICWRGKQTIAFPWTRATAEEMSKFLLAKNIKKMAHNMKFEDRWTKAILKHRVVGWGWDSMIAAHLVDNRPDITSLKFQSFVLLGTPSFDDHIKPYLRTKEGSYEVNRVSSEIDLKDLLLYNGLDSLLEYKIAKKQMELFK